MITHIDNADKENDDIPASDSGDDNSINNDLIIAEDLNRIERQEKVKKKGRGKVETKIFEEDIPILKEIEIATKAVRCSPSKILASIKKSSLEEILKYRELSRLKNDLQNLDIIRPNDEFNFIPFSDGNEEVEAVKAKLIEEKENREKKGFQLKDINTQQFRYIGESKGAEAFFEQFGGGIFSKPLLSIRTQYSNLDISIKANGERGASEFTESDW